MTLQFDRAYALAGTHGHEWATDLWMACVDTDATSPWPDGFDQAREILDAIQEPGRFMPGIPVPTPTAEGAVVHQTGTGRLYWGIESDGTTRLIVSRPAGECLDAVVGPPDAQLGGACVVTIRAASEEFCERHWDALVLAIRQIVHWTPGPTMPGAVAGEQVDAAALPVDLSVAGQRAEIEARRRRYEALIPRPPVTLRDVVAGLYDPTAT